MEQIGSPEIDNETKTKESLVNLSRAIGGRAEYYVGGGLAVYLIAGSELDRGFSDIDIVIPESGAENLGQVLSSEGYEFWDERSAHRTRDDLLGEHGHHEYGARDQAGTRIGIYTFDHLEDGRIVMRNHYGVKNEAGLLEEKVRETIFPLEITKDDLFSSSPSELGGNEIPTVSAEQIYLRKVNSSRPKDIYDTQKLESIIDPAKISRIRSAAAKIETHITEV